MSPLGVFLIVGIVIYGALYWLAVVNAREGSRGAHIAVLLLTAVPALAAVPWALLSWYGWAARCDESCDGTFARRWQDHEHAWQWTGQLVLAVAGLVFALLATACAARRHYWAGALALTVAITFVIPWVALSY